MFRTAWNQLMARVRSDDTVVVAWLDRFSLNFDEGLMIQADHTKNNIDIVAIGENISSSDDSFMAKLFRKDDARPGGLPCGVYQRKNIGGSRAGQSRG